MEVIRGVDLEIEDREFVVFVGPSGCGKSTMLRLIGGLEEATEGQIIIGDQDVTGLPPAERSLSMVFQSYALYPHKTVRENMGFPLKMAGEPKEQVAAAVQEAANVLQLEPLLDRLPKELSGGQRQRVAIGRSIVRAPLAFLFDEPLSNLDAALRVQMRVEIARLHRRLRSTMIYVTHDQVEAMTLAHRIVVFSEGQIEQIGPPLELYENPANLFVATFIGSPMMNILSGKGSAEAQFQLEDGSVLKTDRNLTGKQKLLFKWVFDQSTSNWILKGQCTEKSLWWNVLGQTVSCMWIWKQEPLSWSARMATPPWKKKPKSA